MDITNFHSFLQYRQNEQYTLGILADQEELDLVIYGLTNNTITFNYLLSFLETLITKPATNFVYIEDYLRARLSYFFDDPANPLPSFLLRSYVVAWYEYIIEEARLNGKLDLMQDLTRELSNYKFMVNYNALKRTFEQEG